MIASNCNATPSPDSSANTSTRYIRDAECRIVTGLSRSTRWRLEKAGKFPRRRQLSARAIGWIAAEIEDWVRQRAVPHANLASSSSGAGLRPRSGAHR